jgi:hypothetical protein
MNWQVMKGRSSDLDLDIISEHSGKADSEYPVS